MMALDVAVVVVPLTPDGVASILSVSGLHGDGITRTRIRGYGVAGVFRCQRILVGKTPNLTPAFAVG